MPTFATAGPILATVAVAGARVRVTASDRAGAAVLVEPVDRANRAHVKVADRTKVDFACGHLTVKTTASGDKDGSIAITIDLPAGSGLVTYLAHADVHVTGSLGECELHMSSSRVQLDRVDALQANIGGGEVTIGQIARRATIEGAAFAIRIGEAGDSVTLSSSGGQVRIGRAAGDVDLSSGSASFDIDRADGRVTAITGTGAIRIGRLTRGHAELANHSGNIEVGIGAGAGARVDADSKRGSVHNSVETSAASDDPVTVHARTRHGDITIARVRD